MQVEHNDTELDWRRQFRIIPSKFPPINFFEGLVDSHLMDAAFALEAMTNDRLRAEVGDLGLVDQQDRLSGPGSSIVMAAFTHTGRSTRFSEGHYGVYYAARDLQTAVYETVFHRENFLRYTDELPGEMPMRVFVGKILKPMVDIRGQDYKHLHHPDIRHYSVSQAFGADVKQKGHWGIVYNSVRHSGGECIAVLRPPAVSIPVQGPHLLYRWDGRKIYAVYEQNEAVLTR